MINGKSFIEYLETTGKTDEYSWGTLARIFGFVSGDAARCVWQRYRKSHKGSAITNEAVTAEYISVLEDKVVGMMVDEEKGSAEMTLKVSSPIKTLEELIEKTKIDTNVWTITKYIQNFWGNSNYPCYQVKAFLTRKQVDSVELIEGFFSKYNSTYVPLRKEDIIINTSYSGPSCCFIALTDVHLDKQTIDGQTLEYKIDRYHRVLETLLRKSFHSHQIDEIVFTVGHDLFNSDTFFVTTTNGTQQYNNSEYTEAYEKIFDSQVRAINKLKQFCNILHIKYIPSNHARTKEYFLVHALAVYFKGDKNIIFDRSPEPTKVYTYGENFIGMHHGDAKIDSLPLYFAQKYYKEWGGAKYKEIGVGDKHVKKSWNTSTLELEGVRVFMTPHMGGYGQWDKNKLFDNGIQAGVCRIYDKEKGMVAEFEEKI